MQIELGTIVWTTLDRGIWGLNYSDTTCKHQLLIYLEAGRTRSNSEQIVAFLTEIHPITHTTSSMASPSYRSAIQFFLWFQDNAYREGIII
jgi:hypothetical protein